MKWGIASIFAVMASAALFLTYQTQSADVFAAGPEASSFDINLANGAGIGAAMTLLGGLWASWKSKSPQRVIRSVGLLMVWVTSMGNREIADHCNEIAALAAKEDAAKPLPANVDDLTKRLEQSLFERFKGLIPMASGSTDAK